MRVWPSPQPGWVDGNRIELLENGEAYYPAVFGAIEAARHEIVIETFILREDKVGSELARQLCAAAQRGVRVDLSVDGWGSCDLGHGFIGELQDAGVRVRAFDPPRRRFFGGRLHVFRRMHRKIVCIDGHVAFIGGINFSADHLDDHGPEAKQDYAVRIEGPLLATIRRFALEQIGQSESERELPLPAPERCGETRAMLVIRNNHTHRDSIERQYRAAIRAARREVLIANAYFFPGYRLLRAMRHAARRGVKVRLVLQGQPDMAVVKHAAELLHGQLVRAGVEIHEYCKRPLHGKVALVDDHWATVGSSNLDPLSLWLNLEANLMIRDASFNDLLRGRLERLIAEDCRRVDTQAVVQRRIGWRLLLDTLAYHVTRRFPVWAGWLPAHVPRLEPVAAPGRREPALTSGCAVPAASRTPCPDRDAPAGRGTARAGAR